MVPAFCDEHGLQVESVASCGEGGGTAGAGAGTVAARVSLLFDWEGVLGRPQCSQIRSLVFSSTPSACTQK